MANRVWPVNAQSGAPEYSGRMLRQASIAPLIGGATAARPLGARSGVRPGTPTSTVTATSTLWTVKAHAGILDLHAAAEAGPYGYAIDTAVTGSVTAASASIARVDIVWVRIDDPSESDGSSAPGVVVGYTAGTVAATPPATPARSMVLAWINVPIAGGGAPSVTWKAPYAVAPGGITPVRNATELAALPQGSAESPAYADQADTGVLFRSVGSGWIALPRYSGPFAEAAGTGAVTMTGASGAFTFSLPAGRFTVPPLVWVTPANRGLGTLINADATSATTIAANYYNGAAGTVLPYRWRAVQMTATTAEG